MADVTPEIQQAKTDAQDRILALPGVTGVDIGYKEVGGEPTDEVAIRVLVAEKKSESDVPESQRIPDRIGEFPTDVIQRRFELHPVAVPAALLASTPDQNTYRPLVGGISIGPCRVIGGSVFAGTLGAIVVDRATRRRLGLTNFHVAVVDENGAEGDVIAQPSRPDTGSCPSDAVATLGRSALTDRVDGALIQVNDGVGTEPEITEIGEVTGVTTATLGRPVFKRGRTTQFTTGVVDSIDLTVTLDYGGGIGAKTFTGQIGVRPDTAVSEKFSDHGDSGSVVVDDARRVVGLLFAGDETGYSVVNQIADVLETLGVDLAIGEAH